MGDGIAYQNKDIISKLFAETFGSKLLEAYGLKLPRIVRLLPTNLPAVEANELRLDLLFEMEDGSAAIMDYKSTYSPSDFIEYGKYIIRVLDRFQREGRRDIVLRFIVIFTADVDRSQAKTEFETPCMRISYEPAFLSELDSEEIRKNLSHKIEAGEALDETELMQMIILPLSYREKEDKQKSIRETISMAKKLGDEEQSVFLISGILVFADKVIDSQTRQWAKEWLEMTQIGRMFLEEKEAAVREAMEKVAEEKDAIWTARTVETVADKMNITLAEGCKFMNIDIQDYRKAKQLVNRLQLASMG